MADPLQTAVGPSPALAGRPTALPTPSRSDNPFDDRLRRTAAFLIVALLPLQFLSIHVATTKVDLSNIVLLILAASIVIGGLRKPVSAGYQVVAGALVLTQLALFVAGGIPVARFISAGSCVFAFVVIYGWRRYIVVDSRRCYEAVLATTALLAIVILFQFVVLGIERPAGTMSEPSPAGLILLATAAGLLISLQWSRHTVERAVSLVLAIALVYVSYAIRTTHLLSFAVALLVGAMFSRTLNTGMIVRLIVVLAGVYYVAAGDTHYTSRVDVGNAASNLSLLAWLQGYDQMVASLRLFPITGAGLGGTGTFAFRSDYSDFLYYSGIPDLNRLDAYSGFFRLVIETGPVFVGLLSYAVWLRLREFSHAVRRGLLPRIPAAKHQVFLVTFALTMFVGCMLKEPTYTLSPAAVAVLLFFATPLGVREPSTDRRGAGEPQPSSTVAMA